MHLVRLIPQFDRIDMLDPPPALIYIAVPFELGNHIHMPISAINFDRAKYVISKIQKVFPNPHLAFEFFIPQYLSHTSNICNWEFRARVTNILKSKNTATHNFNESQFGRAWEYDPVDPEPSRSVYIVFAYYAIHSYHYAIGCAGGHSPDGFVTCAMILHLGGQINTTFRPTLCFW